MEASIAQEFYKLREEWKAIDKIQSWRLAVWIAEYPDLDIIDKFLEIERSPIGIFDDLFFRFDSSFEGDYMEFEKDLWNEFLSWFEPCPKPEVDMYNALLEAGLLTSSFMPNTSLPKTWESVCNELVRFRECIKDIQPQTHFCIYIPIVPYNKNEIGSWFKKVVKTLPKALRLVTIDFAQDRRIEQTYDSLKLPICYLSPKMDMRQAVKNEMKKASGNYDTVDIAAQFRSQVITVMESTANKLHNTTAVEIKKLLSITAQINTISAEIGGLLIASQAFYAINDSNQSEVYIDKTIKVSWEAMQQNDPAGYPSWKSCMMLKAAHLLNNKKRKEALETYETLSTIASAQADAYTVMESRRLAAHLKYELGQLRPAFEYTLLSLVAGAYLDITLRRKSTFLHAAALAVFLSAKVCSASEQEELKAQLADWLGNDWESLLQQEGMQNTLVKSKSSIF